MQISKNGKIRPYHREKAGGKIPKSLLVRAALACLFTAAIFFGSISAAHAGFKMVVAGDYTPASSDFGVARYNSNGSLDTSFSGDGKVTTDVGTGTYDQGRSVAIQTDGKVVVAGTAGTSDCGVVRYNYDGTLDTSFGGSGKVITDIGGYQDICNAVVIQSDGKIVVVGSSETGGVDRDFAVIRYNGDGTLDGSFGTGGKVRTSFGIGDQSGANAIAIQTDGKIVVVGYSGSTGYNNFAVARYKSDGTLDTSFSGDGILTTDFGTDDDMAYAVAIQSDGRIVVAGYATVSSNKSWGVARYNTDGSLDTSFDTDGMLTTDFGSNIEEAHGVAIQSDGQIVVAGYATISLTAFAAARYNSDGSLDTSFDTDGKVTTDIGTGVDSCMGMAIQSDGKIVLAGFSFSVTNYDFAVVRYGTDGSLDTSFDTDGIVTTDLVASSSDYGRAIAIQIDCESQDWWNPAYLNRRQLTIDAAVYGYSMKLVLTGADAADIYGKCLASGNDFRVVWYNGCVWNDLDRDLESFSSSNITVWFRIQEAAGWGGGASNYYLYYGNSTPDPVKANKSNIYDLWDDFENINNWTRFTEEGYYASTAFIDGGSVDIGLTATTLAQLDTAFAAGNNFVIAIVQFDSTASAYVAAGDLILQRVGGSTLMSNFYDIYFTSTQFFRGKWYALMGIDTGAGASVSYAVTARANATGLRGEAKILAINGVTGYQAGSASEVSLGSSEAELIALQTALSAGDNIILAITETINTANGSDYLPYVRLNSGPDGGWTALAQSEYALYHGTKRNGYTNLEDMQIHLIPYLDSGALANPRYSVTSQESGGGSKMYGLAKIVAFRKPAGWDAAFVDCAGQTMSSSEQALCTLTPGWGSEKAGREVAVIASEQFKAITSYRTLASGSDKLSYEDQAPLGEMTNEYELNLRAPVTGDDGKGFGLLGGWTNMPGYATQYWKTKVAGGSPDYYGESKILAIVPPASTPLPSVTTDTINLRITHTRSMKHGVFHNSFSTSNSYGFAIKTSSRKSVITQGYHGVAGWYHTQDQYGPASAGAHFYAGETSQGGNRYVLSKGRETDADWEQTDAANPLPDVSFHVYETFVKTDGTTKFTRDGATCFPSGGGYSSAETTLTSGRIAIVNEGPTGSPNDSYYAWILVRKFTDPEPTISAGVPTFVALRSFTATQYENGVLLRWKTGYEVDNLGFHVYREENGQLIRLTPEPVAGSALIAGSRLALRAGHHYHWWDFSVLSNQSSVISSQSSSVVSDHRSLTTDHLSSSLSNRPSPLATQKYWLKDIDLGGKETMHGPVTPTFSREPIPEKFKPELLSEIGWRLQERYQHYWKVRELKERLRRKLSVISNQSSVFKVASNLKARGRTSNLKLFRADPRGNSVPDPQTQWYLASRPAVKLFVKGEGWYRVTRSELVAAGLNSKTNSQFLQLYAEGEEQPIQIIGKKDWDAIEFYGVGLDTPSTDTRVYWLVEGARPGKRIHEFRSYLDSLGSLSSWSFPYTVEKKERRIYFAALRNGDEGNFFGPLVYPAVQGDQLFEVRHLDLGASEDALLEIALQGVTTVSHRVRVLVNEAEVGELAFEGQSRGTVSLPISQSLLEEGENVVTLEAWGSEMDASVIESIRLTYWHTYTAEDNGLRFKAQGGDFITVNGFSYPRIRVIDITEPGELTEVIGKVESQRGGYAISFRVPGTGQRTLLALTEDRINSPGGVVANQPSSWQQVTEGYDLVMISHRDFLNNLQPLKALRESQGLKVALIDIQDVYDEFSFGIKSPKAIRDFLTYAKTKWQRAPRFVLLVGDASYDPRNYLGWGSFDLLPTKLVDTSYFETASDDWFVDFNNDGLPEIAIGRLPVQTAEEASVVVSKIVGYEKAVGKREALLVADIDDGFSFERASEEVKALLPSSLLVRKIYRSQFSSDAQARQELINGINQGPLLVNFIGHGSIGIWNGVLSSEDVEYLSNIGLPFIVGMSCLNGHFQDIYMDSLSEALLKTLQGGAVAVWMSSGLTMPDRQAVMNKELIKFLFGRESLTLGEATARAKTSVSDQDIRKTWILFGDPSTRLK